MLTRQEFNGAVYQQATWLAWLAGFVDGEGSIGIYKRDYKNTRWVNYSVRITITNTDVETLDHIKAILDSCGLAYYVQENQRHGSRKWQPRWQMLFTGFSRAWTFLKLIRPYLVTKAYEADLALEFLDSRMNTPTRSTPYSARDLEIVELLRQAKYHRSLRDYTRNTER